tara:strand:+ start:345 stop:542 length:198 start_codon:yes stop_codon:yes gene_type:complete
MLEVIAFIVWLIWSVWLTALPFLMRAGSGIGGGLDKTEKVINVCVFLVGVYSWTAIFSVTTITFN